MTELLGGGFMYKKHLLKILSGLGCLLKFKNVFTMSGRCLMW